MSDRLKAFLKINENDQEEAEEEAFDDFEAGDDVELVSLDEFLESHR